MKRVAIFLLFTIPFCLMNAQFDAKKLPKSDHAPKNTLKTPFYFQLENELKVYYIQDSISGMVQINYHHDQKPTFEGDKAGLSDLMSRMLGRGTTSLSRKEFLKTTEQYAASIYFSHNGASLSSLQKNFEKSLPLFADALMNPLWDKDYFSKEKDRMIQTLNANKYNAEFVAERVQDHLLFKNHPYGEMVTEKSLKNIDLDDAIALYKKNFNTKNGYLLIRGNFSQTEIKNTVEKYFGSWQKSDEEIVNSPEKIEKPKESFVALVDLPNAVQSQISISYPIDFRMNNKKYLSLVLANTIFGGSFNSRLNMNLREKNGFTYGSRGGVKSDKYQGYFEASAKVKTEVTDSALLEMIGEIKKFKTKDLTKEEIDLAKATLKGNFIRKFEDPSFPLQSEINRILEDLPSDFYPNYLENVEAITKNDIENAIEEFYTQEGLMLLVVGDTKNLKSRLEKIGFPIFTYDIEGNLIDEKSKSSEP